MGWKDIDQGTKAQTPCALGDCSEKNAGRWRHAQRRRMMLAHVIGTKPRLIVEFDQLEAILVLLAQRIDAEVVLIEYTELHDGFQDARFLNREWACSGQHR